MAELHPGPDVSLGQLEAQLRELGLRYNQDYFYARVDGEWTLSLSDENYERWQDNHGTVESEKDTGDKDAKTAAGKRAEDEDASSSTKGSTAEADDKSDDEKSDTTTRRTKTTSKAR